MLKRCTNYYLYNISNHFVSNIIILFALLITEFLSLFYSSIKSSLAISNNTSSQPFIEKLSYASYYEILSKNFNNTYDSILLYLMLFFGVMYLCLKCIALNFEKIRNNKIFMTIFISFYEIIVFRFCAIIFFDVSINKITKGTQGDVILGFVVFIIEFFWFIYHYHIHYIYISLNTMTFFAFDNKIMQISDKYFLLQKSLTCFNNHMDNNKDLQLLLNFFVITLNIISLFHIVHIIWKNQYHHFPKRFIVCFRVWSMIFINCCQLYVIMTINHIFVIFIFIMTYIFIVSIFFMLGLQKISEIKMQSPGNEIGNILFLLSEPENQETNRLIIHNHISCCNIQNCFFCLKVNSKEQITKINLMKLLLKKNELSNISINGPVEYFEIKTILEYVIIYLSEQNFIKIFIKYNKLKSLIHSQKSFFLISEKNLFNHFTKSFENNIDIIFQEIKALICKNFKNQKMNYLSTVDDLISNIQTFFTPIYSFFFSFELRIPEKILTLAKYYYLLKKSTNFAFLKKKENKFNYTCILVNYLIEELYNRPFININLDYSNFLFSMEDTLNYHFNENKIIWILYQVDTSILIIQRIGKDLIQFKGKNFEEIFPKEIRKEGKEKFKKTLLKSKSNFEFYYQNNETKTTEIIRINFFGVPSLKSQKQELNLICTYTIIKVGLIGFHKKMISNRQIRILTFLSEIILKYFKINQDDLQKGMQNFHFINKIDLLDNEKQLLNINIIQQFLNNQTKLRLFLPKVNQFSYECKESISNYEFFYVYEKGKKKKLCETLISKNTEEEEVNMAQDCETNKKMEKLLSITHTYVSSTTFTQQSDNIILKSIYSKKDEKKLQNFFFFQFIYFFSSFNTLILIFIILFLVYEFMNNNEIRNIYNIICQYYDFQNYFYSVSLSISSLICKQDINNKNECKNAFLEYSHKWVNENNLSVELLPIHYIAKEVSFKADMVMRWLKEWELNQNAIVSKKKDDILNQQFEFTILENVSGQITVNIIYLSFEEAVKRFASNVNIISSSDSFLSLSVYTITSNGKGIINLDNLSLLNEELTTIQNLFYTIILNFQKYILRLISLGDLMNEIFLFKIHRTQNINFVYLIFLIILHFIMIGMCLIFFRQFKKIHLLFYTKVNEKLNDQDFITYYKKKLELLQNLLDLFKEPPVSIVEKLIKLKKAENFRQDKISQMQLNQKKEKNEFLLVQKQQEINKGQIEHFYNNKYIIPFLGKLFILFGVYLVFCAICVTLITNNIHDLILMANYTKNNYELSNKMYMGLGLIQIMSLTNQTDRMLYEYFHNINEDEGNNDLFQKNEYVRNVIEQIFSLIQEIKQMEIKYDYFNPIDKVIDMDCSSLYKNMNDYFIEKMVNKYPESNYYDLFSNYCKSFKPLGIYSNHELAYEYIGYQMSQLLNMFIDQKYETYNLINNSSLIYQIYCEIIILIGPIRFFIYSHISNSIINKIIDNFVNSNLTFMIVNIFFEAIILFFVKNAIVNNITITINEIIDFSRALECDI